MQNLSATSQESAAVPRRDARATLTSDRAHTRNGDDATTPAAPLSRMQGSRQCTLHVLWIIKANQVKPNYRGATPGAGPSRTTNFHRFPTVYPGDKATTLHSRRSQLAGRLCNLCNLRASTRLDVSLSVFVLHFLTIALSGNDVPSPPTAILYLLRYLANCRVPVNTSNRGKSLTS